MRRCRGLSLVELMVAMVLVLLVMTAALTWLAQGRLSHRGSESLIQLQESADAALELLAGELRLAGYLGSAATDTAVIGAAAAGTAEPAALQVAGGCGASLAHDLASAIDSADAGYRLNASQPLSCRASPQGRSVAGSDTLTIRHANARAGFAQRGRLQLETTLQSARLVADGQALLGADARWHDLEAGIYYVSADSTAATGQPSLRRKRLVGGVNPLFQDEELVTGVTDLQVELGVDDAGDADQAIERWLPAGADTGGGAIRALRLWVLVQAEQSEGTPIDLPQLDYANRHWPATQSRYRRQLTSLVVQLRNGIEP